MSTLPTELLIAILSFCDYETLCNIAITNHHFRTLVTRELLHDALEVIEDKIDNSGDELIREPRPCFRCLKLRPIEEHPRLVCASMYRRSGQRIIFQSADIVPYPPDRCRWCRTRSGLTAPDWVYTSDHFRKGLRVTVVDGRVL